MPNYGRYHPSAGAYLRAANGLISGILHLKLTIYKFTDSEVFFFFTCFYDPAKFTQSTAKFYQKTFCNFYHVCMLSWSAVTARSLRNNLH